MMFTDTNTYSDLTGRYGFTVVEVRLSTGRADLLDRMCGTASPLDAKPVKNFVVLCRYACHLTIPQRTYCGMLSQSGMMLPRGS